MKKSNLSCLVAAALLASSLAVPVAAQNLAIVNGKPVPKARMDGLRHVLFKPFKEDQVVNAVLPSAAPAPAGTF